MKALLLGSAAALVFFLAPGPLSAAHHEGAEEANPCAAKVENPCNPCVATENPCAAKAENPCNPCEAKNPCAPDEK